ncbi:hypothetical protein VaNZ11_013282, partial [Volvox africanus]
MLLSPGQICCRPLSYHLGLRRQRAPTCDFGASLKAADGILTLKHILSKPYAYGKGTSKAIRQAVQAVGSHAGSWDALALGTALRVPPPAARALATALNNAEDLPRDATVEEISKRCVILQKELGLDPIQVARMVALQPAFLACHTATIRTHAQRLAFFLSNGIRLPAPNEATSGTAATASCSISKAGQSGHAPPAMPTATKRGEAATIPTARPPPQLAVDVLIAAPGRGAGPAAQKDALTTSQAALELIARQPALLEMPMDRLVTRCADLAEILGVAPYDTCLCFTRMRPDELARMLQASQLVIRQSWLGLVTALASLQQPGLYGPSPSIPAIYNGNRMLEASANPRGPGRKLPDKGGSVKTALWSTQENCKKPHPVLQNDRRIDVFLPVSVERAAQRMVLLCPQLLMLPP